MEKTKKRIFWLDNIRAFMVAFIVCFHCKYTPEPFVNFVYPFTLSIFFAISGYFFRVQGDGVICFFLKKLKAYFPIIVFNALIACILDEMTSESIIIMIKKIIFQVYGCESLWFVACMMISQLIMYFTVRICKENANKVLMFSVIYFIVGALWTQYIGIRLPWSIDIAFVVMLFMGIGYWYHSREKELSVIINKLFVVCLIIYILLFLQFPNNDMHQRLYSCIWIYPIQAIVGMLIIAFIFKKYINIEIPFITYLGKNSLYVYAFHGYALIIYNRLVQFMPGINLNENSISLTIFAALFSLLFVYFVCRVWFSIKTIFIESQKIDVKTTGQRNKEIDGIRSIALLFVLIYHYCFRFHEIYNGTSLLWIKDFGVYGVSIFFLISGFFSVKLISKRPLLKQTVINTLTKVIKLWIPYVVSITLIFVITRWIELPGRTVNFVAYLINIPFLNGFIGVPYVDAAHWYMTQMISYIIAIMILQLLNLYNKKGIYGVWLSVSLMCLILQQFTYSKTISAFLNFVQLMTGGKYAGAYIAGILLQFLSKEQNFRQRIYSFILLTYAVFIFIYAHGLDTGVILVVSVVFMALAIHEKLTLLKYKPFAFLGSISYGVYLIHQNLGYIIMLHCPGIIGIFLSVIVAIGLGFLIAKLKQVSDIFVTRFFNYIGHSQ